MIYLVRVTNSKWDADPDIIVYAKTDFGRAVEVAESWKDSAEKVEVFAWKPTKGDVVYTPEKG